MQCERLRFTRPILYLFLSTPFFLLTLPSLTFSSVLSDRYKVLLTGSEDGTAVLWNLTQHMNLTGKKRRKEVKAIEPVYTFRGHSGMVTSVAIEKSKCFTASVDGTILAWKLPALDQES